MSQQQYDGYRGPEGGILGAMTRVKERKQRKVEREAQEEARPRRRPDRTDGSLGCREVAQLLAEHNGGVPPSDAEVIALMAQCQTNKYGRVLPSETDMLITLFKTKGPQRMHLVEQADGMEALPHRRTGQGVVASSAGEGEGCGPRACAIC